MNRAKIPSIVLLYVCLAASAQAQVGDVTLRTNHADYPGEGAFQTVQDCVAFATRSARTPQEKAINLFHWLLTHQFHLYSPQEWNVPGEVPGQSTDDYEMVVYDANRARFSYGYGLCGTVHAWNETYWRALGMTARRRAFPGHVNSEVHYDGGWHAFDTDMAGLVFRPDGVVAGYEDIARDPSIVRPNENGVVCYPFAWPGDFETMKNGWKQVAAGGNWYSMYNSGYAGMPGIVVLRSGESFTRYFDRDVFGGPTKRRFWHVQKDGPFRDWTFVNMGKPQQLLDKSNSRGNASYANALFRYEPNFANGSWIEGLADGPPDGVRVDGGRLINRADTQASVIFQHFSPYVICGDPVDDTNPMTGKATDGLIVTGLAPGSVAVEASVDQGQTWTAVKQVDGDFRLDLTDVAKGRYGWWVRFQLSPNASLSKLKFETTCQMNQAMYPRLTAGGCEVVYQTKGVGVVPVKPNFGLDEQSVAHLEVREMRSPHLHYTPRSRKQPAAYSTSPHKAAEVAFRVEVPHELVEVIAAARYQVRSPQPEGSEFRIDLSMDGNSWREISRAVNAGDNEYSSGWVYGRLPVDQMSKEAIVKVHLDGGGYPTGLIDFEAYGIYRLPEPKHKVEVTWAWKQPGSMNVETHREAIPVGRTKHAFNVPTPSSITDAWVEIRAD